MLRAGHGQAVPRPCDALWQLLLLLLLLRASKATTGNNKDLANNTATCDTGVKTSYSRCVKSMSALNLVRSSLRKVSRYAAKICNRDPRATCMTVPAELDNALGGSCTGSALLLSVFADLVSGRLGTVNWHGGTSSHCSLLHLRQQPGVSGSVDGRNAPRSWVAAARKCVVEAVERHQQVIRARSRKQTYARSRPAIRSILKERAHAAADARVVIETACVTGRGVPWRHGCMHAERGCGACCRRKSSRRHWRHRRRVMRSGRALFTMAGRLATMRHSLAATTVKLADSVSREVVDDIFSCALKKQTGVTLR